MKVKVEITTPDRSDHTVNAMVEGRNQGSDLWVKQKSVDLAANKGVVEIEMNARQRLVLSSVGVDETLVYDAEQRAAIAPSKQVGDGTQGADRTDLEEFKKFQENEKRRAEEARLRGTGQTTPGSSGGTPNRSVPPTPPDTKPAPLATPANPNAGSQPTTPPSSTPVGSKEVKADDKK